MRCLAVCHTELVVRLVEAVLASSYELDVLVGSPGARRLGSTTLASASPLAMRSVSIPTSADDSPPPAPASSSKTTAARSLRKVIQAIRAAGGTLIWVLGTTPEDAERADALKSSFPEVNSVTLAEFSGPPRCKLDIGPRGRPAAASSSISATCRMPSAC